MTSFVSDYELRKMVNKYSLDNPVLKSYKYSIGKLLGYDSYDASNLRYLGYDSIKGSLKFKDKFKMDPVVTKYHRHTFGEEFYRIKGMNILTAEELKVIAKIMDASCAHEVVKEEFNEGQAGSMTIEVKQHFIPELFHLYLISVAPVYISTFTSIYNFSTKEIGFYKDVLKSSRIQRFDMLKNR